MKDKEFNKIVVINQASGYLTVDIVNALSKDFTEVYLISSEIRFQDVYLNSNVKWIRTFKHSRKSNFLRLFKWMLATVHIAFLLVFKFRKFEIFYISIPPFAYLISLITPNKFYLLIYDLYPDVLELFGVRNRNIIFRIWKKCNKIIFKKARIIFTISETLSESIRHYSCDSKIIVIPNWTGIRNLERIPKDINSFLKELNLQNKFIIQYSGNLSPSHKLEILLDIAEKLADKNDIHFLIIGRGQLFNVYKAKIIELNLSNITLLPYQPDNLLRFSLAAADLSIVSLPVDTSDVSMPSKIYNIMAVGVPILAISADGTELDNHVKLYNLGSTFLHSQLDEISQFIMHCFYDREYLNLISNNSYSASSNFTFKNADLYANAIKSIKG